MRRLQLLMRELRHRHLFKVAGVYVVAAWVAVQVADTAFPGMAVPDAAIRYTKHQFNSARTTLLQELIQ